MMPWRNLAEIINNSEEVPSLEAANECLNTGSSVGRQRENKVKMRNKVDKHEEEETSSVSRSMLSCLLLPQS